jgi:uncharacterized SAM-binding protein YcdF (DUF218 family)
VLAGIASVLSALFFSVDLLRREDPPGRADAIVVLGGDVVHRPARALELYQQGAAPVIVISGNGDCQEVRVFLAGNGVPATAIQLECGSRTTRENALLTVPLLRARRCRRVMIVTSWFHSRRALNCFRHDAPEIEFVSAPTTVDLPKSHWPNKYQRGRVVSEYLKLLYYWPRYGVWPL